MKNPTPILLTLVLLATLVMLPLTLTDAYALSVDACDAAFTSAVSDFMEKQGYGSQRINAEKDIVYDIELNELGVCYSFTVDNEESYAIVIEQGTDYLVSECYFASESPFESTTGMNVYVSPFCYLEYRDGNYYGIYELQPLSDEMIQSISSNAYRGTITFTYSTEVVNYSYRTQNAHKLARRHPQYTTIQALNSSCAVVAGGNIIGYYDRYSTDLIPNYTPGNNTSTGYIYKSQSAEVNLMLTQLYSDMGTTNLGTTYAQFISGMTDYCDDAGYDISFTSCMSGTLLDYAIAKDQLNLNKPIALFLTQYNIATFTSNTNEDIINYMSAVSNHVIVGFGYLEVTYTYSNSTMETYRYIEVASGLNERKTGYFNIDHNVIINHADAISIY